MRSLIVFLLLLSGCSSSSSIAPKKDISKAAVHQWLKDNLPDGKWEEIEWWKPAPLLQMHNDEMQFLTVALKSAETELQRHKQERLDAENDRKLRTEEQQREYLAYLDKCIIEDSDRIERETSAIAKLRETGPKQVCAIKVRAKKSAGALDVSELIFEVQGQRVEPVPSFLERNAWEVVKSQK